MPGIFDFIASRPSAGEESVGVLDSHWWLPRALRMQGAGDRSPRIEEGLLKGRRIADLPVLPNMHLVQHALGQGDVPPSGPGNLADGVRQVAMGDERLSSGLPEDIIPVGRRSIPYRCVNPNCGAPNGGAFYPYCRECYIKSLDPEGEIAPVPKIIDPKQYQK